MCDHQDSFARLRELLEQFQHQVGIDGIQVAGRFISHQHGRIVGQGAGDGGALLLSARKRGGEFVGLVGNAHHFQQLQGARFALTGGDGCAEIHCQQEVFLHGQRGQQLKELEHHPHIAPAPDGDLILAESVDGRAVDA